jgi:SAM-dependent methyltransferase
MGRVDSEKEFHNSRFAEEGNREGASRYYLALENWYRHYTDKVLGANASHVLEIGSGVESISMQIPSASFELQSIDIAEEAVRFMQSHTRLKAACFSVQDAHHMSFPDSSFDLAIGRGILHHLDLPLACEEIKRVLKPDGAIIFGEPLAGNPVINCYRRKTPQLRTKDERPLSSKDLALLKKHFGAMDVSYYGFLTLGLAVLGLRSPRVIHALDYFLLNKMGLGRFLAWACILSTTKESK